MEKIERQRPTAEVDNNVGKQRYERYKSVIDQYNKAIKDGYFLEAITLMESLISDRLESLANYVAQKYATSENNYSFMTIGYLINFLNQDMNKPYLSDDMCAAINVVGEWRIKRNIALHEMAKIESDDSSSFEELYKAAGDAATEGMRLFRMIDKEIANIKK